MTWTVILNASLATFYHEHRDGSLELIQSIENPAGRARGHDLVSDRQGRASKGSGRRVVYEAHTDPTDVVRDHLLAEVIAVLIAAVNAGQCEHIVLIAPPRLLGRLRARLPETLAHKVIESFPLDLGRRQASHIPAALKAAREAHRPPTGAAPWPQSSPV